MTTIQLSLASPRGLLQNAAVRRVLLVCVALPVLVGVAVLLFAWPAARVEPRSLPVGVVGTSTASQQTVSRLQQQDLSAYDLRTFASVGTARRAVRDRDVYGALTVTPSRVEVLTASAASPAVARLLDQVATKIAAALPDEAGATSPVVVRDVVATDQDDPQGLVLTAALLPLTICSIIIAAVIALVLRLRPALRVLVALPVVSMLSGLAAYLVVGPYLDVLPDHDLAAWATLSLLVFAMSATTAGLISLLGSAGLGLGALLLVFVGNPFSASTTAPELLPDLAHYLGQALPPGAGSNLLRDVVYFDGNDAGPHLTVLIIWAVLGLLAVLTGHRSFVGFAARMAVADAEPQSATVTGAPELPADTSETTRSLRPGAPAAMDEPESSDERPHQTTSDRQVDRPHRHVADRSRRLESVDHR